MAKWWMSVALVTLGAVASSSPAQQFPFMAGGQGGQGGMPEPLPISPTIPGEQMMPGPGGPGMMPGYPGMMAGPDGQGMMPGYPGMTPDQGYAPGAVEGGIGPKDPQCRWYGSLGYQALQRQAMPSSPRAFFDPTSGGVDTGSPIFSGPVLVNANDLQPHFSGGVKAMFGYQSGNTAYELSGFYDGQTTSNVRVVSKGSINAPSFNPPLGFEGDNGMFLQADVFQATLKDAVGNAEFNCRKWVPWCKYMSYTCGLRYLDIYERYSEYTGDDDLTAISTFTGLPDPTKEATYTATAHNRIIAPQLGVDFTYPIGMWLALNAQGKAASGVNIIENDVVLERGDGLIGREGGNDGTAWSSILEIGANLDVYITPHCRIRAGYNCLWALHVVTAINETSPNLAEIPSLNRNGSMFFSGPSAMFEWAF